MKMRRGTLLQGQNCQKKSSSASSRSSIDMIQVQKHRSESVIKMDCPPKHQYPLPILICFGQVLPKFEMFEMFKTVSELNYKILGLFLITCLCSTSNVETLWVIIEMLGVLTCLNHRVFLSER